MFSNLLVQRFLSGGGKTIGTATVRAVKRDRLIPTRAALTLVSLDREIEISMGLAGLIPCWWKNVDSQTPILSLDAGSSEANQTFVRRETKLCKNFCNVNGVCSSMSSCLFAVRKV